MLVAITGNGRTIVLTDYWNKKKLLEFKDKRDLFCPTCKSPVIPKLGKKIQWHFAHEKESAICKTYERESDFHLLGKKQLYFWLKSRGYETEIEKYLPMLKQRPDLLYVRENRQIALEFQCSPIPYDLHYKRTTSYIRNQMFPLWIIGSNRIDRCRSYIYSLQPFEWSSTNLIKPHSFPFLLYYCPYEKMFILLKNMITITASQVLAQTESVKMHEISSFSELYSISSNLSFVQEQWFNMKRQWRYTCTPYPSKAQKFFYNYCYHRRETPFLFPAEAGWPVENSNYIETPLYIWQSWILYEFICQKPLRYTFSFKQIYDSFKRKVLLGVFNIRIFPTHNGHYSFAIMSYLKLLVQFGILEWGNIKNTLLIKRKIKRIYTIEEALKRDKLYINLIKWK